MGKVKIDTADRLFSLWIRHRDKWTCKRCGTKHTPPTMALHCSHFKGRGKEATRFEPSNADALCYGCHQYFTSQPDEHYSWQVDMKGQEVVDGLTALSNSYKKKDRKAEIKKWRSKLKEDFDITA